MFRISLNINKLNMTFELPKLQYSYDALEPFIDTLTMNIHHEKHHGTYVSNLNNALQGTETINFKLEQIIKNISNYPTVIRNNGGGHYNHSLFWSIMSPNAHKQPTGTLLERINSEFGNFDKFKEIFTNTALTRFGSGWAWLYVDKIGKLCVCSTPNQDNPLMDIADCQGIPIMGIDVWEHAYYLKYQNRRAEYINAFWNVLDWSKVVQNFEEIKNI